jgi:hypothetical protein
MGLRERTRRLAARVPDLDIFSQGLVERLNGGWRITNKGRSVLEIMEARPAAAHPMEPAPILTVEEQMPAANPVPMPSIAPDRRKRDRKRRHREMAARARAKAS